MFRNLSFRLSVLVGLALAAGIAVHVTISIRTQEKILESLKAEEASLLADTIKGSLTHAMQQGEEGRAAVREVIRELGERPEIERIRIYDARGKIRFSTLPEETGRVVDKQAENCVMCHGDEKPGRPETITRTGRFFYAPSSPSEQPHRMLGVITPIRTEEHASCIDCHTEDTVLGVLDVVVSMERLDRELGRHRSSMILFGLLGLAAVVAVVAVLLHLLVHRPVGTLVEGTRKVAGLELDHRLPAKRRDELGALATSFNEMTARLQTARSEIRAFTDSLEHKVQEKTAELHEAEVRILRGEKLAAVGRMASGAAHEINNPLAGLITFVELLKRKIETDAVGSEELDVIHSEAMRCATIVRGLLDFAREGELKTEPANLKVILDGALDLARKSVGFGRVRVVRNYPQELPLVPLDGPRMEHALLKLVSNALEAMEGEGTLTLTLSCEAEDKVRVDVMDTGPGIPAELQGKVFDPFFTTKGPGEGTGLGLSVVYGIVEAHGGHLTLDSAPGAGAKFTIELPIEA